MEPARVPEESSEENSQEALDDILREANALLRTTAREDKHPPLPFDGAQASGAPSPTAQGP